MGTLVYSVNNPTVLSPNSPDWSPSTNAVGAQVASSGALSKEANFALSKGTASFNPLPGE